MYNKPRLRGNFDIVKSVGDKLIFKSEHLFVKLEGRDIIDFTNIVLPKLDGKHTFHEIVESLSNYKSSDIRRCLQMLAENKLLEEGESNYDQVYTAASHLPKIRFLNDMGIDVKSAEEKISRIRITIFGLGGHGAYLLPALANEGISNIKCVDTTQVSEQDLYISPIYKNDDVNKFRETAIIERVKDDFPRTKFEQSGIDSLDEDGVNRILNDSDIVVSCVDKGFTAINYWVNKAALKRSLSWYSSSLDGAEASVGPLFIPGKTPCYMCYIMRLVSNELVYRDSVTYLKYLDVNKKDEWAKRCLLAVNPAILANYLASEIIKNLIGIGSPLAGKVLLLNLLNLKTEIHNILRIPNCPHCGNSRR